MPTLDPLFFVPSTRAVTATLIGTVGSSPRHPGARMWVDADGRIVGAVTIGGCVDARVLEAAREVLADGRRRLLHVDLGTEDAAALGMTCAGSASVLVEHCDPSDPDDELLWSLVSARQLRSEGRDVAIVTRLDADAPRLILAGDSRLTSRARVAKADAALEAAVRAQLESARAGQVQVGDGHYYADVYAAPPTLVVFGATAVAQPLVTMGRVLGFRTVVVDGRAEYATRDRFPEADEIVVGMPSEIAAALPLSRTSSVIVLAHDYKYDVPVLAEVLQRGVGYIGCLGSVRRGRAMLALLSEQGVDQDLLARVRIPVGLDIGAATPAEIALSVLAEALAVARGATGLPMRERPAAK